jgi:hypothetical protein
LAALYTERWEVETALAELKTSQRGPKAVLRSKTPDGVDQEVWAYLLVHYALRRLMHQTALDEDLDPDRLSFTRTLRVAGRQLIAQAAFPPDEVVATVRVAAVSILSPTHPPPAAQTPNQAAVKLARCWPVALGHRVQGVVGAAGAFGGAAFGHERAHDALAREAQPFQDPPHGEVAHRRPGLHSCRSRPLEQPLGQQRDRLHAMASSPVGRVVHDDAEFEDAGRQGLRWATTRLDLADQTTVRLDCKVEMAPRQPSRTCKAPPQTRARRGSTRLRPRLMATAPFQHRVQLVEPQRTQDDSLAFQPHHARTISKLRLAPRHRPRPTKPPRTSGARPPTDRSC